MTQCPYPETVKDEYSGVEIPNDKYRYWHEGYEAHKFEMASQAAQTMLLLVNSRILIRRSISRLKIGKSFLRSKIL